MAFLVLQVYGLFGFFFLDLDCFSFIFENKK